MIYDLYKNFIRQNKFNYMIYFLAFLHIPLNKVGLPHFYGKLLNQLQKGKTTNVKIIFLYLVITWFVIQLLNIVTSYMSSILLPKFQMYVRSFFIEQILERHQSNYQDLKIGDLITKIIKSPYYLKDVFYRISDFIFRNIIVFVSIGMYLSYHHLKLGGLYALCIILIIGISYKYFTSCNKYVKIAENTYDITHEEIEDTLSNLLSVYTSQQLDNEKARIGSFSQRTYEAIGNSEKCNNKFRLIYTFGFVATFVLLNYYSYYIYQTKEIKLSTLIAIFIINYSLLSSFMIIFRDTRSFISTYTRLNLVMDYLQKLPNMPKSGHNNTKFTEPFRIEFKNVTFSYPNDKNIFEKLNLVINAGEKIAIMGEIGSGKSTLSKLLTRLQDINSGDILLNDIKHTDIPLDYLRQIITYIPQRYKLFNRTLWENISYGLSNITRNDIYDILNDVGLYEVEKIYRYWMDKPLGKNGSNLSAGLRQIVWLIRCILRPSPTIILDEPTSSLDAKNKERITHLIQRLSINRTLIIITHDRDLLPYLNRLIIFDKGKIIEDRKIS